ncbi:TIGR02594 family protein, partial [Salmonella enterica subsp. enterica serovar Zongo]|nr:TIGR02594 family protein [Salmonella enterica subsp. enterica serovar Zongo]
QLLQPALGCVAVFTREGGGHVGFVVGQNEKGDLMVLGGNQSDAVNIRSFPRSRVSGYRWPVGVPDEPQALPTLNAEKSTSEA